jgi:KDO2-lipid IV(A) lauroyltransferase
MTEPVPTFSHRVEQAGLLTAKAVLGPLGIDRGVGIAAAMGRPFSPFLRKRALGNLRLALPELTEAEHRDIVRGMTDNLVRTAVEYLHLAELRDDPDRIAIHGVEHLESARAAGRGAVLVTGHLGNWEAIRAAFARHGWPPAIIYRRFNNPLFDAESRRLMGVLDAPTFHKGKRGTLGLLRHIRKGGAAMILTDQRFSGAPKIPFFGIPAKTSPAPADLAIQYGAAILPVRGIRRGRSSMFDVTIDPPLDPGTGPEANLDVMRRINDRLETWIRENPEQYFWLHNRWGVKAHA